MESKMKQKYLANKNTKLEKNKAKQNFSLDFKANASRK